MFTKWGVQLSNQYLLFFRHVGRNAIIHAAKSDNVWYFYDIQHWETASSSYLPARVRWLTNGSNFSAYTISSDAKTIRFCAIQKAHLSAAVLLTFLTRVSSVARQAKTEEWINLVHAGPSIFTWFRLAVIYICEEEGEKVLIRRQIEEMYSAEVTKEKKTPIHILTQNEFVIGPA